MNGELSCRFDSLHSYIFQASIASFAMNLVDISRRSKLLATTTTAGIAS